MHAGIFNGLLVWVGGSVVIAAEKSEQHSKAMQEIEKQLTEASLNGVAPPGRQPGWPKKALIRRLCRATAEREINKLLDKAEQDGTDAQDAEGSAQKIAEQAYLKEQAVPRQLGQQPEWKIRSRCSIAWESCCWNIAANQAAVPLWTVAPGQPVRRSPTRHSVRFEQPIVIANVSNEAEGQPQSGDDEHAGNAEEGASSAASGLGDHGLCWRCYPCGWECGGGAGGVFGGEWFG